MFHSNDTSWYIVAINIFNAPRITFINPSRYKCIINLSILHYNSCCLVKESTKVIYYETVIITFGKYIVIKTQSFKHSNTYNFLNRIPYYSRTRWHKINFRRTYWKKYSVKVVEDSLRIGTITTNYDMSHIALINTILPLLSV